MTSRNYNQEDGIFYHSQINNINSGIDYQDSDQVVSNRFATPFNPQQNEQKQSNFLYQQNQIHTEEVIQQQYHPTMHAKLQSQLPPEEDNINNGIDENHLNYQANNNNNLMNSPDGDQFYRTAQVQEPVQVQSQFQSVQQDQQEWLKKREQESLNQFSGESVKEKVVYLRWMYIFAFLKYVISFGTIYYVFHYQSQLLDIIRNDEMIFYYGLIGLTVLSIFGQALRKYLKIRVINFFIWLIFTGGVCLFWFYMLTVFDLDLAQMVFFSLATVFLNQLVYVHLIRMEITYQGAALFILGGQLILFQVFSLFSDIALLSMVLILCASFLFNIFLVYTTMRKVDHEFSNEQEYYQEECFFLNSCMVYTDVIVLILEKL